MATTTDLTDIIARTTGVNPQSVVQVIRNLRADGFVSSGGRGRHAAKMTVTDVAHVLIAMLISDRPVDAAGAVKDSKRLQFVAWREAGKPKASIFAFPCGDPAGGEDNEPRPPLQFTEAVAYVIRKLAEYKEGRDNSSAYVEITFDTKDLSCQIVTSAGTQRYFLTEQMAQFVPTLNARGEEAFKIWEAMRKSYQHSEIGVRRTLYFKTLFKVSQALAEIEA